MVLRRKGRQAVTVRDVNRAELKQFHELNCLGSEIDTEGGTAFEIKQRVEAAKMKWKEV